jgi:hypothetical protein
MFRGEDYFWIELLRETDGCGGCEYYVGREANSQYGEELQWRTYYHMNTTAIFLNPKYRL